jgi:hypothetical protein
MYRSGGKNYESKSERTEENDEPFSVYLWNDVIQLKNKQ